MILELHESTFFKCISCNTKSITLGKPERIHCEQCNTQYATEYLDNQFGGNTEIYDDLCNQFTCPCGHVNYIFSILKYEKFYSTQNEVGEDNEFRLWLKKGTFDKLNLQLYSNYCFSDAPERIEKENYHARIAQNPTFGLCERCDEGHDLERASTRNSK